MQVMCYSDDVIKAQRTHDGIYASIAYDFNLNLHPVCAVNVLLTMDKFWIIFSNSCACE